MIFDDMVGENKYSEIIKRYFKFGRNKGIHILFLTQSYKSQGSMMSFIRKQASYILLCGIKSNSELKDICSDYSLGEISPEQMALMYKYCKKDEDKGDIDFMKITTYHCPESKKISLNFLQHLDPKDFPVEKKKRNKSTKKQETEEE